MSEDRRVFHIEVGTMTADEAHVLLERVKQKIRDRRPGDTGPVLKDSSAKGG